jgi:hypothetical protein
MSAGPEWVAAVGTVAAFGVTSWALVRDHQLRARASKESAYDDALKVDVTWAQAGDYSVPPDVRTVIGVTVTNGGRRAITDVSVAVETDGGRHVGTELIRLVQAGWHSTVNFPTDDDVWAPRGGGLAIRVTTAWSDTAKTRWALQPTGELLQK